MTLAATAIAVAHEHEFAAIFKHHGPRNLHAVACTCGELLEAETEAAARCNFLRHVLEEERHR